jgi:hypothetical protein
LISARRVFSEVKSLMEPDMMVRPDAVRAAH